MLERVTRHVDANSANERDDDTCVSNRYFGHRLRLDGRKPRIDEVSPREDHLLLEPLEPSTVYEGLRILVQIMPGNFSTGDVARDKRLTFSRGHNTDHVVFNLENILQFDLEHPVIDR